MQMATANTVADERDPVPDTLTAEKRITRFLAHEEDRATTKTQPILAVRATGRKGQRHRGNTHTGGTEGDDNRDKSAGVA